MQQLYKLYILFFLLSLCNTTNAQQHIIHYNISKGLPHDVAYGMFQDSKGYIWIGTDNGLVKFNGQNFRIFNNDDKLRNNYAIAINEDNNKNKIVATWGGGIHIIKNDSVVIPEINNDENSKLDNVFTIDSNVFVQTVNGNLFYKKNGNSYIKRHINIVRDGNAIKKIVLDTDFSSANNGFITPIHNKLFLHNGKSLFNKAKEKLKGVHMLNKDFSIGKTLPFLKNKIIESISFITDNTYAATQKDSIFIFNDKEIIQKFKSKISESTITKVHKTKSDGYLILGSNDKGYKTAYLFNENNRTLTNLSSIIKTSSPISDAIEDHENNIWISTFGDGVYMYNPNQNDFKIINDDVLPENDIKSIINWKNDIVALTQNHVITFNGFEKRETIKLKGLGKNLSVYNEKLLINSLHPKENYISESSIEKPAYKSFVVDSVGLIIHGDSIKIPRISKKGIFNKKIIYDCVFYKDTLWFATNSGAYYYEKLNHTIQPHTISGQKLISNELTKFYKQNDSLYIATLKGLHLLHNNQLQFFDTNTGLINNRINNLTADHKGNLWITTQNGVSIYNGKSFINITNETGLSDAYIQAICEDKNNNIWLGGSKGITIIDNTKSLALQAAPILNIIQNNSNFTYDVISYNRSKSLQVEYKIDNHPWQSQISSQGTFNFDNLDKGDHTFLLRAKKQDGVWGFSKKYQFKIITPWYKNSLFILLATIALLSGIIVFIIRRLQRTRKRNKFLKETIENNKKLEKELENVKDNIAQDFHDDLGNKLARISILSNLITSNEDDISNESKQIINQISDDANYLFKGTKDFIFSLKEESNYLEELITYLSDFGEEYFSQFDIDFIVNKSIDNNIKLPYYWSKQLIFIFKEAMTNVVKHANASKIELQFLFKDNTLEIKCIDNGKGFDATTKKQLGGLSNMQKRAKNINCILTYNTSPKGTVVYFTGKTA